MYNQFWHRENTIQSECIIISNDNNKVFMNCIPSVTLEMPEDRIPCIANTNKTRKNYYSLLWAIPCNDKKECENGSDEDGNFRSCKFKQSYLALVICLGISMITLTLFVKLKITSWQNKALLDTTVEDEVNDEEEEEDDDEDMDENSHKRHKVETCPSLEKNDRLSLALRLNQSNLEAFKIFNEEIKFHGQEADAICCMKVRNVYCQNRTIHIFCFVSIWYFLMNLKTNNGTRSKQI